MSVMAAGVHTSWIYGGKTFARWKMLSVSRLLGIDTVYIETKNSDRAFFTGVEQRCEAGIIPDLCEYLFICALRVPSPALGLSYSP